MVESEEYGEWGAGEVYKLAEATAWTAGINESNFWASRVEVHGDTPEEAKALRDVILMLLKNVER